MQNGWRAPAELHAPLIMVNPRTQLQLDLRSGTDLGNTPFLPNFSSHSLSPIPQNFIGLGMEQRQSQQD
jgi:hypothetical protein